MSGIASRDGFEAREASEVENPVRKPGWDAKYSEESLVNLLRDIDAKFKQFESENETMKQFSSVSEMLQY